MRVRMSKDLFCTIMRPSSTNKRIKIGILRILRHFSRMCKNKERYKANKIEESVDPWPTPTLTSKLGEDKLFYK